MTQNKTQNKTLSAAQQQLVSSNIDFARGLAQQIDTCGVPLEDLEQESCLGLCEAALRFDESLGVSFRTFAFYWCRRMMFDAILAYSGQIALPEKGTEEVKMLHLDWAVTGAPMLSAGDDDGDAVIDGLLYQLWQDEEAERESDRETAARVRRMLRRLTTAERRVIEALYGLHDKEQSAVSLATEKGVTPQRISMLESTALSKMAV